MIEDWIFNLTKRWSSLRRKFAILRKHCRLWRVESCPNQHESLSNILVEISFCKIVLSDWQGLFLLIMTKVLEYFCTIFFFLMNALLVIRFVFYAYAPWKLTISLKFQALPLYFSLIFPSEKNMYFSLILHF